MVGGVINGALVTVGQAGGERVREGKKKKNSHVNRYEWR